MIRVVNTFDAERAANTALFNLIQNKEHWKNPIHCVIPKRDFEAFNKATIYFTGEGLSIVGEDRLTYECVSNGYWGNGMG